MSDVNIGWIDFNQKEREKALELLEQNKGEGTVDELGLGIIRDYISDKFFSCITTVQTRAKYFLLVPYWIDCVINGDKMSKNADYLRVYFELEKEKTKKFNEHSRDKNGIIGTDTVGSDKWLVRSIAETYWSGIWKLGIIKNLKYKKRLSLSDCLKQLLEDKKLSKNKDVNENDIAGDFDDKINESIIEINKEICQIEKQLVENENEEDYFQITLNKEEAEKLKTIIVENSEGNLLSYAFDEGTAFENLQSFDEIDETKYPDLQDSIMIAKEFRKYALFVGKRFSKLAGRSSDGYDDFIQLDKSLIEKIFDVFDNLSNRYKLKKFVLDSVDAINHRDGPLLNKLIKEREIVAKHNKQTKSKIWLNDKYGRESHEDTEIIFDYDFRLRNAGIIIKDIKKGLED